jgi:LysR family transcriptional activator of nhaA
MVNFNNLYSFYVCAEHLNISKAAALLGISQPSLSMQIKNLEDQVGTTLFLRNGKSISLTSKGHALLKSSNLYFDLKNEIKKCMESKADTIQHPTLRILVTDQVERPFVAEVVSKVAKKAKGKMAIFSSTTEEALNKTENNETDILLSHEKVDTTWNYIKVDFPVFFVTGSAIPKLPTFDHTKNIQKVLDYFGEDLIVPASSLKLGKEFASFKRKNSIKQNVLLESNIISCLVRFVASGTGCSFLPLPYIKSSLYESHIHMIGPRDGYWKHSIYIYANIPEHELENHPLVKTIRAYGSF